MKVQCMHCNKPACVSACIVGALQKNKSVVRLIYDAWKCIGCRYCMVACPFQIPAYEYHKRSTRRCASALSASSAHCRREETGLCGICPNEALIFGTREELIDLAKSRIERNPGRICRPRLRRDRSRRHQLDVSGAASISSTPNCPSSADDADPAT